MLSAGIVRSDNALVVSFVKLFLFPNLLSCILFAWTCFFIATISTGPSSWGDPLPIFLSAGVSTEAFCETLELAAEARAKFSGVLCGRAVWQGGIAVYGNGGVAALDRWLEEYGRTRHPWVFRATALWFAGVIGFVTVVVLLEAFVFD